MALNITINKTAVAASYPAGSTVATAVVSRGTTPYTYSLATGGDYFNIDASTGVVTTKALMDASSIQSFSVTATDSNSTPESITSGVVYPNIQAAQQSKFNKSNVIYKIVNDIDLGNAVLTIPAGCTLDFQGGSINNGAIVSNSCYIQESGRKIFDNIIFSGKLRNKYLSVLSFGAMPTPINSSVTSPIYNYSVDNTEAFQKAVDSGVDLIIPNNHFYIAGKVIIRKAITISGENNRHFLSGYTPYSGGTARSSSDGSSILYTNMYGIMFEIKHRGVRFENCVIDYTQVTKPQDADVASAILLDLGYGLRGVILDLFIIGKNSITYDTSNQPVYSNDGNDIIGIQTYNSGDNGDWDGGMYLSGSFIKGTYENLEKAIDLQVPLNYDWDFQQTTGYINSNTIDIISYNCKQAITAINCGALLIKGWAQTGKYFKKVNVRDFPVISLEKCYDCELNFYSWDCEHYYQMNDTDYYRNALATKIIRSRNTFDNINPSVFQSYDTVEVNRYPVLPINNIKGDTDYRNVIISDNIVNAQIAFNNALSDYNKKYGIDPTITAYPSSVKSNLAPTTDLAGGKFYFTGNVKTTNFGNNTTSGNLAVIYDNSSEDSLTTEDFVEIYFPHANGCFHRFEQSTLAIGLFTNNGIYPKSVSFIYGGNEYVASTKYTEGSFANTYYIHSLASNIASGGLRIRLYGFTSENSYNEKESIKYLYISHCYLSSRYKSNNFLDLNGDTFQELVGSLRMKTLPTYTGGTNTLSKTRKISYHSTTGYGFAQLTELDQSYMPVVILDASNNPSIGFKIGDNIYNYDGTTYNRLRGNSTQRPTLTSNDEGFQYYDSTLKKMILWNGTAWVNLDGTPLA
jgi:hypothetical protein